METSIDPDAVFSYLDSHRLEMCIDNDQGNCKPQSQPSSLWSAVVGESGSKNCWLDRSEQLI
jgi:hypothetical protein